MYRGAMAYWIVIVIADEVAAPGFAATSDAVPAVARSEARGAVASVPVHSDPRKEVASRQGNQSVPATID
jgi:hypothetical protein